MPTHASISESLIRPPGNPPSSCRGLLGRVDGAGNPLPWDSPPVLDACQPGEGEPWQLSAVRLYRCSRCRSTLVVATGPDGTAYARNDWEAAAWDREAGKPVAVASRGGQALCQERRRRLGG